MELNQILFLAATGILAGFISGWFGVGGAIIIVPALVYIFHMGQHEAQGTSLAVLSIPAGFLIAAYNYHQKGYVNYKFALVLMITFFVGSYLGSKFALNIPAKALNKAFGILLLLIGIKIIFGK